MTARDPRREMVDRIRRTVARAALPRALREAAERRRKGVVEAGDAEYVVRQMQQAVIDHEGRGSGDA